MTTNRMETFSDGVLAIVITIMVLEMKVPHGTDLAALRPLWSVFVSYVLSFVFLAIYWNNHHHMLHLCRHVNGRVLWANMHLLFWLSLVPFVTGWMGENGFAPLPTAVYGGVLLMSALAYSILQHTIIRTQGPESELKRAIRNDWKGKMSLIAYIVAIAATTWSEWVTLGIYILVALIWLVPDRRIERVVISHES